MSKNEPIIDGYCDSKFEDVKNVFTENFAHRNELGASVCVFKNGEKVVDLWGGHKDSNKSELWEKDTIVLMNSVAKSICSISVHILSDKGLINLNSPVCDYWREFGQAGKENITVANVLGHECGAIFSDTANPSDWYSYEKQCAAIAAQEPAFTAGTNGAYNTVNIGFILGEVVRHVTGKNVGQFIRDEISLPLNAEYQIGLKDEEAERLSDMHLNTENAFWAMGADPNSNLHRAWSGKPASGDFLNSEHIRKGIFPAFGGHGNARGVATIYAALAGNGQLNGVRILSENAVKRAAQLVWERKCYMTGWDLRMGLGFEQNSPYYIPMGDNPKAFGKFGSGGAIGFCDREKNLSFSYATNFQCEGAGIGERSRLLTEAAAGKANF